MSHPSLLSHLPRTASSSPSSFTLPSTTTPEHALQSGQHDLLQEHRVHHQPLQDLPVDKRRHQEPLWRENLQSGGNPRKTFSTDCGHVELLHVQRVNGQRTTPCVACAQGSCVSEMHHGGIAERPRGFQLHHVSTHVRGKMQSTKQVSQDSHSAHHKADQHLVLVSPLCHLKSLPPARCWM